MPKIPALFSPAKPGPDGPASSPSARISATLQTVWLLAVLIFLVNYTFEVLAFNHLYEAQIFLLALLQLSFCLWALGEVVLIRQGETVIPLRGLKIALTAQLLIGAIRYPLERLVDHAGPWGGGAESGLESGLDIGLASLFVPLYLLLFLIISRQLIVAFSLTERRRAELLQTQIEIRQRAEEALRQSEERYRLIADHATDVIWTMDAQGRFTYVSPAVHKLRGYSPAEVMAQGMAEALTPDSLALVAETFHAALSRVAAGLPVEPFRGELEQPRKDGMTVWTEVATNGLYNENGEFTGFVGITRDITERRRLEGELRLARQAAEDASRAKSDFLAHMSHEIRTPLNGILGLAQVLEREPLTPTQREMVRRLRVSGRALLSIINDILDLSKIEAGQLRLEPRPFALAPLLEQVTGLMAGPARDKGLALRTETPPELKANPGDDNRLGDDLVGDDLRLEQILLNLVGNAIKFTERGEINLRVRTLARGANLITLRFEVEDNGIGIAPEVLPSLFNPFTQADSSITRRFGGTGLGLSISCRLVELMGGTIGASSTPGVGSLFWFELPFGRAPRSPGRETCSEPAPLAVGPRLGGIPILVVEDNDINLEVVSHLLTLEGALVSLAQNGQEALDILRDRPTAFAAVLMDCQMPVMDGLTATRHLRHQLGLNSLPVIAFSAGVLPEERQQALDAGMNDFLVKPVDLNAMVAILQRWTRPAVTSG